MNRIAVVICNWNKRDLLVQCINSLFKSSFQDFDLFVVDNNSSDGSVEALKDFQHDICIIENKINLGGSGGFNTGIRAVLNEKKHKYKYILLLDNDVIIEESTLYYLYKEIEEDQEIALLGAKLYSLDQPSQIQEFGSFIDWEKFNIRPLFKGITDNGHLPEQIECDYVPACCALVQVEAIRKAGLMDEGNFIYWDDIEWGYRLKRQGYKVRVFGKARAWHKLGATLQTSTFPTYYFWRNRINFFMNYTPDYMLPTLVEVLFNEGFKAWFFSKMVGQHNVTKSIYYAFDDALNRIRGIAKEDRILLREPRIDKLEKVLLKQDNKPIIVIPSGSIETSVKVINRIKGTARCALFVREEQDREFLKLQFPELEILSQIEDKSRNSTIQICDHIYEIRNHPWSENHIYVDGFFNIITSQNEFDYLRSYDKKYNFLKSKLFPFIYLKALEFRNEKKN